jgi:transcriptional regulator with XRE-family HTH domain
MSPADTQRFDAAGFYQALAATVKQRQVTWKEVSKKTGVSPTTLTRMGQGRQPDGQGLASLAAWAGLNAAQFVAIEDKAEHPETLAIISTALRRDPELSTEAASTIDVMVQTAYEQLRLK